MIDQQRKQALGKIFGVKVSDGLISQIPMRVPGLLRKLTCYDCKVKISKGLPIEFIEYMTDEQKAEFKALTKRKRK